MKQLLIKNKQTSKNPSKFRKLSPRLQQLPMQNEVEKKKTHLQQQQNYKILRTEPSEVRQKTLLNDKRRPE